MRVEELSIGDWVVAKLAKWDYDSPEETEPMCIVCIDNSEPKQAFADLIGGGIVKHSALIEDLRPIPLTPEILEKNGICLFETFEDGEIMYACPSFSVLQCRNFKHWKICTPSMWVHIRYIHQLQHTLRLSGIEKEIEV